MKGIVIFGKKYIPFTKGAKADKVQRKIDKIVSHNTKEEASRQIKTYLEDLLFSELNRIYDRIIAENKIDVFGKLDFEIVDIIDKKRQRIAKIKENRISVKLNAVSLSKGALKYLIAHEIAHLHTKKHGTKFWRILGSICPDYKEGQKQLMQSERVLRNPIQLEIA